MGWNRGSCITTAVDDRRGAAGRQPGARICNGLFGTCCNRRQHCKHLRMAASIAPVCQVHHRVQSVSQVLTDSPSQCCKTSACACRVCILRQFTTSSSTQSQTADAARVAVLESQKCTANWCGNKQNQLPSGARKDLKNPNCRRGSIQTSAMARPAGRLMSLLQKQSKEAKAAIEAHLAPAVAKGSVRITSSCTY